MRGAFLMFVVRVQVNKENRLEKFPQITWVEDWEPWTQISRQLARQSPKF
jgi:hypothetical protein